MNEEKFTFIDLFAGCGGLSEGFLSSGKFEGLAHVEWELPMVKTLRKRLVDKWGHTTDDALKRVIHFDIQKTKELISGDWGDDTLSNYGLTNHKETIKSGLNYLVGNKKVDIVIGGPPCQAYSIHGRATDTNSMKDDYRNFLFESFARIVEEFQPEIFVFENVPGILTAKPGGISITDRINIEFEKIGYEIPDSNEMKNTIFNSCDFGVAQNRKRVLIIGVKKSSILNKNQIYKRIKLNKIKGEKVTVRDAIGALPPIFPLKKAKKENGKNISHKHLKNGISHHVPRYNNSRDIEIFKDWVTNKMNYIPHKDKIEFYLNKTGRKTLYSKYRNLEWDKQSYTIVAHLHKDGLMFIHPDPEQARSITIREAALLMSFPIDYEFVGSNAYCYKMIGNAVPVKFAEKVAISVHVELSKLDENI